MKTYIITDSTSEITQKTAKGMDIIVAPLSVCFDDKTYFDGIDITPEEFFQKLEESKNLPKTSQVTPEKFKSIFEEILKDPEAEIFGIFISSKLSGTYQSAMIASEETDNSRIFLVDSLNATGGLGLLVHIAVDLRTKGFSAEEIKERIEKLVPKTELMVVFATLKYLKAGGRISATTAAVGGLLQISPIAHIENGIITTIGKARGKKATFAFLTQQMQEKAPNMSYPISFMHSNMPEGADELMNHFSNIYAIERCIVSSMGPVIGTHTGPNCISVAYIKK